MSFYIYYTTTYKLTVLLFPGTLDAVFGPRRTRMWIGPDPQGTWDSSRRILDKQRHWRTQYR